MRPLIEVSPAVVAAAEQAGFSLPSEFKIATAFAAPAQPAAQPAASNAPLPAAVPPGGFTQPLIRPVARPASVATAASAKPTAAKPASAKPASAKPASAVPPIAVPLADNNAWMDEEPASEDVGAAAAYSATLSGRYLLPDATLKLPPDLQREGFGIFSEQDLALELMSEGVYEYGGRLDADLLKKFNAHYTLPTPSLAPIFPEKYAPPLIRHLRGRDGMHDVLCHRADEILASIQAHEEEDAVVGRSKSKRRN